MGGGGGADVDFKGSNDQLGRYRYGYGKEKKKNRVSRVAQKCQKDARIRAPDKASISDTTISMPRFALLLSSVETSPESNDTVARNQESEVVCAGQLQWGRIFLTATADNQGAGYSRPKLSSAFFFDVPRRCSRPKVLAALLSELLPMLFSSSEAVKGHLRSTSDKSRLWCQSSVKRDVLGTFHPHTLPKRTRLSPSPPGQFIA